MARTPVLFVPGLAGSFNLPLQLDWRGPTLSGWNFPPFIDYGKQFLAAFERAGYTRDRDLFVAFYDWRKAVRDSATVYLKPWIDRAKQRSGAKQVILIGHSMGGLVSRSYIQSKAYANDVERLITLGTPHRGSAEAYYAWGSGEPKSDPTVKAVFDVYLWYLRHAHPFQSDLNPIRTIRSLVPGIRDLLPIDNYLLNHGGPAVPKQEDILLERNLWGDMLNQPAALETLLGRVPVSTYSGVGFSTIEQIVVGGPFLPPGEPPRFPDGVPVSDQVSGDGDGTVSQRNAQLGHPKAKNAAGLAGVSHGMLPDHPTVLAAIFGELQVTTPALDPAPTAAPQLVIMTASPVRMTVEAPGGTLLTPPGVLGSALEDSPPQRPRRLRARDHGHSGKHLNIAVIANPTLGSYRVRLDGTATGGFALGAMLISPQGLALLGGADAEPALVTASTAISTTTGQVAAATELLYEVVCQDLSSAPVVRLDTLATARNLLTRLRSAVEASTGGLLGGDGADPVGAVLGAATAPDELRDPVSAALGGDTAALERVVGLLGGANAAPTADLLSAVAERVVGVEDETTAQALIAQLQALK